jgi:hypothetical protein
MKCVRLRYFAMERSGICIALHGWFLIFFNLFFFTSTYEH